MADRPPHALWGTYPLEPAQIAHPVVPVVPVVHPVVHPIVVPPPGPVGSQQVGGFWSELVLSLTGWLVLLSFALLAVVWLLTIRLRLGRVAVSPIVRDDLGEARWTARDIL